jgi:hypothetical protein
MNSKTPKRQEETNRGDEAVQYRLFVAGLLILCDGRKQ